MLKRLNILDTEELDPMPLPVRDDQINRPSMRDEVFNKLLTWISEGILIPGEKLLDKDLAEHMGVSRTPVREAMRRLEDMDLIESSANRWTRVSKISSKEPEMIYPIIWTLESLASSFAIGTLVDEDFKKMSQANKELEIAYDRNDPVAASRADAIFHNVFIERTRNAPLIKILQDLKIRYRRLEVNFIKGGAASMAKNSIQEHETIISAFKTGDTALVSKTIHANWKRSLERLRGNEE